MASDIIAGVFGKIFTILARNPEKNKEIAKEIWDMVTDYEFDLFLMGCGNALVRLGLASMDDDGFILYKTWRNN